MTEIKIENNTKLNFYIPELPKDIGDNTLIDKKKVFLEKLRSKTKPNSYKRYLGTPLRYAGGKTLAVGHVVNLLPNNIKRVVSPFLGGASVEIAIAKELNIEVIGYDIFDILINYWHYQINEPKKLATKLKKFKPTKEEYLKVKEIMKKHWKGEKKITGLDLAATYYFNHNTSYGPSFLGWQSSIYQQENKYKKTIEKVRNFDCKNLKVFCESFETVIPKHKNDFLYCDPPYYLDDDSKMFIGMYPHRNFPIHHRGFKHELLRDLLKKHKGGFILSYNDCSTIREWYKEFNIISPSWQYTFGQGETRIGKNRINKNNGSHIKKTHELIIWMNPKN
ncbi:MAG: DNA adenine methylase [Candidatus Moeniiplasma glomeromycotorum]|nr:DNA adenine methylase [Candidatus Moeniiplasma glomeromycotorum]MCE8162339.1 DNA adenine methylase [Candidatus Moeniiplasma glomeromycotorum]MCE8166263.1 DNA adenine methylase [Candidatus Moeniiplasma glomeromycotorum]MCE8166745.1 DNA adenine methylase [Candidatus Moeniiplasma glomeromycotorum]